ncbi:MAG: peroxiredoxin family protein [Planctomycetota bacterium]|jgi:peroxiredoxin
MQRIVNRSIGLGCGLVLVCAGLVGCSSMAEDWTFTDASGTVRNLSDYRGEVVVLGFSNTWCDPCQEAALHMQDLHQRFGQRGVRVVSVSAWERGEPDHYMEENGYSYGLMLNGTEIAREYGVIRVPTFFIVGVDGKVIYRHDGFDQGTSKKMARVIEKHLEKQARKAARNQSVAQHGG